MENKIKLGEYIREIRRLKKYSLRKLGEITDISYSHLSKIERGEHTPEQETLEKISKALRIDKNRLLILAGYIPYEDDFMNKLTSEIRLSLNNISDNADFETLLEDNIIENFLIYQLHTLQETSNNKKPQNIDFIYNKDDISCICESKVNINESKWSNFIEEMDERDIDPDDLRNIITFYDRMNETFTEIKSDYKNNKFKVFSR